MGKWNVTLEIDLPSLSKKTLDSKVRRVVTPIFQDRNFKLEFGKRIIDAIIKRTESGKDKKGAKFTAYKESYTSSQQFKIFKGRQKLVDLHLSGEMLASMDVTKITRTGLKIGFISDEQEAKAHGHINGGGFKNSLPVRDFFGLPVDVQAKILQETIRDFLDRAPNFDFGDGSAADAITDFL